MSDYTTMTEIHELIKETFDLCEEPELYEYTKIQWNSRFTSRMGDALYYHRTNTGRIRFSPLLWNRASPEERRETVIHEACHIVAERCARRTGRGKAGHGPIWKRYMKIAGAKGDRCHTVNRDGLKRKQKRVEAYCGCRTWQLTQNRATRMQKKRTSYSCKNCMGTLQLGTKSTSSASSAIL